MSATRRTVSSWRWPFLTRLRALGRYLNEMSFGPRVWLTTSALTDASATSGRPIVDSSPSATSRTRSIVIVLPGSTSSSSTSSSVPTSTRYCFPPVSMTAYMDPQGSCLAAARGDRDIGREKARGGADAQNAECTAPSTKRSIATGSAAPASTSVVGEDRARSRTIRACAPRGRASQRHRARRRPPPGARCRGPGGTGSAPGPRPAVPPRRSPRRRTQRPQVVRRRSPSPSPLARQRGRRRGARPRPSRRAAASASAELDPVVGGGDLAGQGRRAEPDVVEVDEPPAVRAVGPSSASRTRHARDELGQDDVGELALERHPGRHRRPERDARPRPTGRPMDAAARSPRARRPRHRASSRPTSVRRRPSRAARGASAGGRRTVGAGASGAATVAVAAVPASPRHRTASWSGSPRLVVCGTMDEPAPPVAEGPASPLARWAASLPPPPFVNPARRPGESRFVPLSPRARGPDRRRRSSPASCCGWLATASGRSSSGCCSSTCSIRPSAGWSGAACGGRSRSWSSTSSGSSLLVEFLALTLTPLVNEILRFIEDFPKLAESLDDQLQRLGEFYARLEIPVAIRDWIDSAHRRDRRRAARRGRRRRPVVPAAADHRCRAACSGRSSPTSSCRSGSPTSSRTRRRSSRRSTGRCPATWRFDTWAVIKTVERDFGQWVRGQIILGFTVGIATFVGLIVLSQLVTRSSGATPSCCRSSPGCSSSCRSSGRSSRRCRRCCSRRP